MGAAGDGQTSREFLSGIHVGDVCSGTIAEATGSQGLAVILDGFSACPLGTCGRRTMSDGQYDSWGCR
ncbi:hypothetical protein ADL00_34535 [Streptomyces sp. AS58]|nr:hypothetical protein ADL00_34535 [Streptomyces sp. AS58]